MGFLLLGIGVCGPASATPPIFENQTPTGFSTADSTAKQDFIEGDTVGIRVDLNQAATPTYPVIGHFHNLERSLQVDDEDVDGMRVDVALTPGGIVHLAWISQEVVAPVTTPVYSVVYARSNNSGKSFSEPVSVSGNLRFDILTADGAGVSFSSLDLEVDSRGNPRVVYAFNHSPDGGTAQFSGNPDNIYFNYSEDGGASWLPGNGAVVVNDTVTVGNSEGLTTAFPRLAIDQRDNVFVTYVRGASAGGGADDIMLARVRRSTSPFTMEDIGSLGTAGSSGGVRLSPDGDRQTGPDIAVGSGDVLHLTYYNDADDDIEHKSLLADDWQDVDVSNWNQSSDGADVDDFDNSAATNAALETDALFYFPTVVVDQVSVPDKVYALYKFGDATYETVFFNSYTYDNGVGANAGWSTGDAAPVWSTASTAIFASGNQQYNVELEWTLTERVAAVVDDRRPDQGDLHIVFSAGYSSGGEHDIYYGYYNGSAWTLPEKVADDDSDGTGSEDGIANTDVYLGSAALAKLSGEENLYLAFVGGLAEGLGIDGVTDADHHPYIKVLGRDVTSEDESMPVGAYQYDLSYTPVNAHATDGGVSNQAVYVHVADHLDGSGLGASGAFADGFLAGEWETVGTTLADDDKAYEGEVNEDGTTTNEWGDDDDKVGLLVKLNVLGSDSATNLQVVTNSTASASGTGLGARTVRVGSDPTGSFVAAGSFFALGADIDIVDANSAPSVAISEPDGSDDQANLSYVIKYDLVDSDDDIASGDLEAGLYFAADSSLATVQDIRIFATLIADQNDNSSVFASGSDDFAEGENQLYTWDEPADALQNQLFASILKVPSGTYYIYLVADDGKNPPVFARSPGALTIIHSPIIDLVEPVGIDTVDTGVRSGKQASPYDLDFRVRDFERQGSTQVQLFYSAVSGISSVSASGVYPNQNFVLGKSLSGTRGVAITNSDTLTSTDTEFLWDLTDSVYVNSDSVIVDEGTYYVYLVASDSANVTVEQSEGFLAVKHSPSFTFYEPAKDTHRRINTGSQPVYTLQWQKGRGDYDFDDDAEIDFYFSTDNPATINYEDFPDSLLKDADTRVLVEGLSEDGDGADDIYVWDLRAAPNDVPADGTKVWLYAMITDAQGNSTVALGGGADPDPRPLYPADQRRFGILRQFQHQRALAAELGRLPSGRRGQHRQRLYPPLRLGQSLSRDHPAGFGSGSGRGHRFSAQQRRRQPERDHNHGAGRQCGFFRLGYQPFRRRRFGLRHLCGDQQRPDIQ